MTITPASVRRDLDDRVVTLPRPLGGQESFQVEPLTVMEPGLARRHPELTSFVGHSLDDPTTTVALALTPLGVSASVRGPSSWTVEPDDVSGGAGHIVGPDGRDGVSPSVELSEPVLPPRSSQPSRTGAGRRLAAPSGEVVLRTYRLALVNDPTYAAYFGSENVVAAKVALVTRLNQIYNDDLGIRFVLVDGTDRLNLDTAAEATGADGPCGASPCYAPGRRTGSGMLDRCGVDTLGRTRLVLANLIGSSAYDVGHLVLGVDGGGVAWLGVAGRDYAGGGCTGLEEPRGDVFHVDYVAHELGHQFGGEHTFNGAAGACAGNGTVASVEPGSGSSIMAYAGICGADDLQPHTDPYFSQHTIEEVGGYVAAARRGVVEVQQLSLSGFDTDGDTVTLTVGGRSATLVRGERYTRAAVQRVIRDLVGVDVTVARWDFDPYLAKYFPESAALGQPSDAGFQIIYSSSARDLKDAPRVDRAEPVVVGGLGVEARLVEIARGGSSRNGGEAVASGNSRPVVTAPARAILPMRTPFKLVGAGTDVDGDPLTFSWEQDDPGYGTPLLSNRKEYGPLFRQFGDNARVTEEAAAESPSPGQNATSSEPIRWFPDLEQVLRGRTNAASGACPKVRGAVARDRVRDCYSEFLPTHRYLGAAGRDDRTMHFRLTARDRNSEGGGTSYADVALRVSRTAGPFLVRSQGRGRVLRSGSTMAVRWAVNGTRQLARRVRILLSTDDGASWSTVLAERTANDGMQRASLPTGVTTDAAWVMVEARGNYFYDVNDRSFAIE